MGCCSSCIQYQKELKEQYKIYGKNTNWMSEYFPLLKDKSVFEMIIPGSHNSGTYNVSKSLKNECKCQNISINRQLDLGIRFLDFKYCRKGDKKNDVWICNRSARGMKFTIAMQEIKTFLFFHSKEFIIVRLNQD